MQRQLLIIDDDRAIHALVSAQLSDEKTRCISAMDGIEGIQLAADARPSAILLDLNMPKMDGMEVCRRLKANPQTREIPVVLLSADPTMKSRVQAIDTGACDYVVKPFNPFELRARVGSAFRSADALQSVHTLAGVDEATGLWNRAYLFKQVEAIIATAARAGQWVSCCFVALDRFDELAVMMGQPGGADLIRQAAESIMGAVRPQDTVCRYDTRIFAVLGILPNIATGDIVANRLRSCASAIGLRSFVEPASVTCSIGFAMARDGAGPAIFRAAGRALAKAQAHGNLVIRADSASEDADPSPWLN